jgi:osmotically-inducible protein OsmY
MFETQTAQTKMDESNRCRDRLLLLEEDEKRFGGANLAIGNEDNRGLRGSKPEPFNDPFDGLIHIGLKVFLPNDHFIGLITKLLRNPSGQVSHIAVRTARLFGRHKMVPIAMISEVTSLRALLSITRDEFMDLPGYPTDQFILEEVDRALWKDIVVRDTDYDEIDVQVRDGIITLNGHVITSMIQWRVETAVKNIPGSLGVKSYLIPDDKLTVEVAQALGHIEQYSGSKFYTKVEQGVVVLVGEVSSTTIRDQAVQCIAEIPWVRGIINEIRVTGIVLEPEDQRFLQPVIGKELQFKDALSVTIRKVIINPHNRRVVAMVGLGRFPAPPRQESKLGYGGENSPESLVVLPVGLILHLTRSTGYLRINSAETNEYEDYDPSRYITPDKDWLPPYPYCTDEVLFLAE